MRRAFAARTAVSAHRKHFQTFTSHSTAPIKQVRGTGGLEGSIHCRRFFSAEKRAIRRQAIKNEITERVTQGPFFSRGQTMESMDNRPLPIQTELFKPKEAKLFSGLGVKNLLGEELKVPNETSPTLLAVGLNQLSFGMLESWVNAIWEDQTVPPSNLAIIQLSVVESWLFRMLSWMILFPMRSRVNPALHKVTAVYFGSFKGHGRIRWKAAGSATEEEVKALKDCIAEVIAEK